MFPKAGPRHTKGRNHSARIDAGAKGLGCSVRRGFAAPVLRDRQGRRPGRLARSLPAVGGAAFRGEERIAVRAAGRYLALNGGAAPVETGAAMYRVGGEDALLLCESDGRIIKASANGYALLAQASGCPINRQTVTAEIERAGQELIRRLLARPALPSGRDARGPSRSVSSISA